MGVYQLHPGHFSDPDLARNRSPHVKAKLGQNCLQKTVKIPAKTVARKGALATLKVLSETAVFAPSIEVVSPCAKALQKDAIFLDQDLHASSRFRHHF
jgi:hypothetical protein